MNLTLRGTAFSHSTSRRGSVNALLGARGLGRRYALLGSGLLMSLLAYCGIYTFSGSSLPGYVKTVDIPLFSNESLQPGIAEHITEELNSQLRARGLLRIVSRGGDATLGGTVISYSNQPYTYAGKGTRDVNISEYAVRIAVAVTFMDNKKNHPLYRGTVTGEGIYRFQGETEEIGASRAIKDVVERIIQNSVQGW